MVCMYVNICCHKKLYVNQCERRAAARAHEQNYKLQKKTRQIVKVLTAPKKNFNIFLGNLISYLQ